MENGKIFISYRREDTSGESGRLKDNLAQIFGAENIFYDVETLEAGLNFDESIAKALSESKVVLAMIGPHWMKVSDSEGVNRLQNPEDWVRKEIAEALRRNLRVIPILVNGADMPDQGDLPDVLKGLSLKHAQELSSSRWSYDVGVLSNVLEKLIAKSPSFQNTPKPGVISNSTPRKWWDKSYVWAFVGILAFVILITVIGGNESVEPTNVKSDSSEVATDENSEMTLPDLSGKWNLNFSGVEGNYVSTCVFSQDGQNLTFTEYNSESEIIGEGTAHIEGQSWVLNYSSYADNMIGTINLTTDNNAVFK